MQPWIIAQKILCQFVYDITMARAEPKDMPAFTPPDTLLSFFTLIISFAYNRFPEYFTILSFILKELFSCVIFAY